MPQAQTRPVVNLAALFALNVKPVDPPALGRAARAIAEADSLGLDLIDLNLSETVRNPWGFGPAARTVTRLAD